MSDFLLTVMIIILLALLLAGNPTQPVTVYVEQPTSNDTLQRVCSYDGADKIEACRGISAPAVNQMPAQPLPAVAPVDSGLLPGNAPQPARDCPFVLSPERLKKCLAGQEY